jgi:hypothetical protein
MLRKKITSVRTKSRTPVNPKTIHFTQSTEADVCGTASSCGEYYWSEQYWGAGTVDVTGLPAYVCKKCNGTSRLAAGSVRPGILSKAGGIFTSAHTPRASQSLFHSPSTEHTEEQLGRNFVTNCQPSLFYGSFSFSLTSGFHGFRCINSLRK